MEQEPRNEITELAEKVRFWQEQDRINQALIPRVLQMHASLVELGRKVDHLTEQLARVEDGVGERALQEADAVRSDLLPRLETVNAELDALRREAVLLAQALERVDQAEESAVVLKRLHEQVHRHHTWFLILALLTVVALLTVAALLVALVV